MTNDTTTRICSGSEAMSMMKGQNSFALNYALMQYGHRVMREVATLIRDGHEVAVAMEADGFRVDGTYRRWTTF